MEAVRADGLTKVYATGKQALSSVSFALDQGAVFGFLGPNGAGKTTTVKILTGMLSATQGSCRVLGCDPATQPEKLHAVAGVVTEHAQMYDNLTGRQNLEFYATLFGVTAGRAQSRSSELLDAMGLVDAADQKLASYSTGMRQRLSLARAIIHEPTMLFLDEPTSGLDPESAKEVNDLIVRLARDRGTTVFLCTHQLRYAQEICTSYGLVDQGSLLATGGLDSLRAEVFSGLTLQLRASFVPSTIAAQPRDERYDVAVTSEAEIPGIVRQIVDAGGDVYEVSVHRPSLEEIYFALIERDKARRGLPPTSGTGDSQTASNDALGARR